MTNRLIFILVILLSCYRVNAQLTDISSLPFNRSKMLFNPALTGNQGSPTVSSHLIHKWPALGFSYHTEVVTYEHKIDKINSGLGVSMIHDSQGDGFVRNYIASVNYSYYLSLGKDWLLSGAIRFSYFDGHKAEEDMFLYSSGPYYYPSADYNFITIGSGVCVINNDFIAGFAVDYLTKPEISVTSSHTYIDEISRSYYVHAGYSVISNDKYKLTPILIFHQHRDYQFAKVGVDFKYRWIICNLSYMKNFKFHYDSVNLGIGYQAKTFGIMYNYEMTVSKLTNQTLGTHMLSLNYKFNKKNGQ